MTRAKWIILVVLSCFISFAAVLLLLRHQFTHQLYIITSGAFIGWYAVACRGKLPDWLREHWRIADDSAPGHIPVRILLPILAIVIAVAGLLFFYVVRY